MKRAIIIWFFGAIAFSSLTAQQADNGEAVQLQFTDITLKTALDSISARFQLRLSYSDSKINSARIISANYSEKSREALLAVFLKDQQLDYTIIDDQMVIFPINTAQTTKITGRVTNAEDGSPVPFAGIALPDYSRGTSTNEEGEFELDVSQLPVQLMVSHIAFQRKMIFVYDGFAPLEINLTQAPRQLKGITVQGRRDKNAYYQLLKNARELITQKMGKAQYGKAFYRQKSERQGRYTEIFEMFYDVKYTRNGIEDWAVQEGRYAYQNKDEYDVFLYNKNFTLLSRMFTLLQPRTESYLLPFHTDAKAYFDLSLQEVLEFEGRHIAVINYKPFANVDKPAPSGQLFIDFETFEVFKMTGTFTDGTMNVIGFSDQDSSWDNYELSFDIAFDQMEDGELTLNYIHVDHRFDYYFRKEFIGNIHTRSFLSFYEQYKPVAAKKLGGPVDFKSSDAQVIDRIGYNREFWLQNPVVKRTPLEEKLILDFDRNEAFGVVFLNQDDQIMLLPDRKNSEKTMAIIEAYESNAAKKPEHRIFLRLDKNDYLPAEKVQFVGNVVDTWSLRPSATGSVLTLDLMDASNNRIKSRAYDINQGAAYGEFDIENLLPGTYEICASINTETSVLYKRQFSIVPALAAAPSGTEKIPAPADKVIAAAEGGLLLENVPAKVVVAGFSHNGNGVAGTWILTNKSNEAIASANSDEHGLAVFNFVPLSGDQYFVKRGSVENTSRWPLPPVVSEGICMLVKERGQNSIRLAIRQKPALTGEVFILSAASGKVYSAYNKTLTGTLTTIDLPTQHLPAGINELVLTDIRGRILASHSIYIDPPRLSIESISTTWKSRKNQKLELAIKITDMAGTPAQANLSAIYGNTPISGKEELTVGLLLSNAGIPQSLLNNIPANYPVTAIDNLLILADGIHSSQKYLTNLSVHLDQDVTPTEEDKILAEVAVSSIATHKASSEKSTEKIARNPEALETMWLPKIFINQDGIAVIECRAIPGEALYICIQGLSNRGEIADFNTMIPLDNLKDKGSKKNHNR